MAKKKNSKREQQAGPSPQQSYIKVVPAGEITVGKLDDVQVSQLRDQYLNETLQDLDLVARSNNFDDLGHTYGLFTSQNGGEIAGDVKLK